MNPFTQLPSEIGYTFTDVLDEMAGKLAKELARSKDRLITEAITRRLGHSDWMIPDVTPRLTRQPSEDGSSEIWALDGRPIVEIWPAKVGDVMDGPSIKSVARIAYLFY